MSSEKNPEVVGCAASIMKNIWEIRAREYRRKMQLEQERVEKSALPSIDQEWSNRSAGKGERHKRVGRTTKPAETQTDNNDWRSKQIQVASTLPRGASSGLVGRPKGLIGRSSIQAPNYKDNKKKEKNKLELLTSITQIQPSAVVWGKSWKFNKSLPPAEGPTARTDWGQCWMFATQQPYSEEGQPWPNGPNMIDPHSLRLSKKVFYRMMESKEFYFNLPTEEWQTSWKKSDKSSEKEDSSSENQENIPKCRLLLVESQHLNKTLCSSEWSESWQFNKPASEQEHFKQEEGKDQSSGWKECWRLVNHHGCNKSKSPQSQEWVNSWRAAMMAFNINISPLVTKGHSDTYDDYSQQRGSDLHKIMLVCHQQKHKDLHFQLCNGFKALFDWSKSWQVTKNNSKPSEEIEKVLNALPPQMSTTLETLKMEENKKDDLALEKAESCNEQLKHNVIYQSEREFTQTKWILLNNLVNVLSLSEWGHSWKTLKHRMRMERMKSDHLTPFRESQNGQDMRFTVSEWKSSRKLTCQFVCQQLEFWKQSWSSTAQVRVDRASLKNEPIAEQRWTESWKFSRHQHQSEPGQHFTETSQERSNMVSHHPYDSQAHFKYNRPICDWQLAWMVSQTQFHHDKPSLTQWRNAWKWSIFHTKHWNEKVSRENWVDELEIHTQKERFSLQKINQLLDKQMFRKIYSEIVWGASSKAGSLLNHQQSHYGYSGTPWKSITTKQQDASEHGAKWRRSFRLANPMPQMEQPWGESLPDPCHYTVLWSVRKNIQNNISSCFSNNPANFKLWRNSQQFLQAAGAQMKNKGKSKELSDPRVIITKKTKCKKHLYSNTEKEKQSERKWAGCHLLGKTQPRPRKDSASLQGDKLQDKYPEEWVESWRFLESPGRLKKPLPKSLSVWNESWKFLLPPYQPMNSPNDQQKAAKRYGTL